MPSLSRLCACWSAEVYDWLASTCTEFYSTARKFDRGLSRLRHDDLDCLDVRERVKYKLSVTVHRCLQHKAPQYLMDCCTPVSHVSGRQRLCSASRHYHDIGAVRSAVGSSLLLVRRSGARCQSTFEIRRTVMITLQSHWRRGCFESTRITSVLSGLEVSSRRYAM